MSDDVEFKSTWKMEHSFDFVGFRLGGVYFGDEGALISASFLVKEGYRMYLNSSRWT